MVKLVRDPKSGSWKSRKVIPPDVSAAYGKANDTPTWPATLTPAQAKAEYGAWLTGVEAKIARLRQVSVAKPVSLSNREVHALAGQWYSEMVREYEDNPGDPNGWDAARDKIEPEDPEEAYAAYLRGETWDGPVKRVPWLAEQLQELLAREELSLDPASWEAVVDAMHDLYLPLCNLMIRRASGDYGFDRLADTLPAWQGAAARTPSAPSVVSLMGLFDRYVAERQPAAATQKAWKRQLGHLKAFLRHDDAARVGDADIVAWKDSLLNGPTRSGKPRSARTVRDTYLAVAKTIFRYAVDNRLLPSNPAAGITVRGPKTMRLRDRGLTDSEAGIILKGSLQSVPAGLSAERALALRWVPWLCAYTGARVNEMTQLRREDVFDVEGIWVVRITPEAGSTKTNAARVVPLHSQLIEQGFVSMAQDAKAGPLFFDPKRYRGGTDGNPQSKKVGEASARWVRDLGVNDPNVAPNHGWRHRFETEMRRADLDYEARHLLVGHSFKTESGDYGQWDVPSLQREVEKLRRYAVSSK